MEEHRRQYAVCRMCSALKVSAGGYYVWRQRPESSRSFRHRYTVGGKGIVASLDTASEEEARKKQQELMKPLELATAAEALAQTELRLKQVQTKQQAEWESRNPPLKLGEAWNAYLSAQNRPRSGPQTLSRYASHYKQFIEWLHEVFPAAVYMKDVGVREAEVYTEYLGSRKLSPSTYNQNLNGLALVDLHPVMDPVSKLGFLRSQLSHSPAIG